MVSCLAISTNSSIVQVSAGISMPASSNILVLRYMTFGVTSRAAAYMVPFTVRASFTTGYRASLYSWLARSSSGSSIPFSA